jgi:formylglycine-generating enzyme required for sulfatase activity
MAGKIFINYRRGDDAGFTHALYQRLEEEFSPADLFMDVEGHIKPGDDFVEVLNAQIAAADVVLVVIGPRWTDLLASGQSDRDDFVAIEINAALAQGKRLIPLLVGGADMPRSDTLPEAIRPLARRNAVGLRPERFKTDCQGLITALKDSLAAAEQERAARTEAERNAASAARLRAEAQAAARAEAAEERGRTQAAAGLSGEEIRKAEELASWDFVKDRNDVQDLRDHLARFPNGPTERWARAKLDGLVWTGLGSMPVIESLRAYLDEFPKGANAGAAQAQIAELEREAAQARAAEQRRRQETAEWDAVAVSTDKEAIKAFLKRWPNGQHADAAWKRIAELRRDARRLRRLVTSVRPVVLVWVVSAIGALAVAWEAAYLAGVPMPWPAASIENLNTEKAAEEKLTVATQRPAEEETAPSVPPDAGRSFRDRLSNGALCPTCPEMVVVPEGKFTMGSPRSEPGRFNGEDQVSVSIGKSFAVGKFAVTRGEFAAFVEETGRKDESCFTWWGPDSKQSVIEKSWHGSWREPGFAQNDRHPVVCVNWNDAKAYAEWLSNKTGKAYRLLSEAEREYVTRAGTTTPFWWGTSITPNQANYSGNVLYQGGGSKGEYRQQTVAVDSFEPNSWGLYNVHGNAWEFTEDCWNASNKGNPGNGSARTTGNCGSRVLRGGCWHCGPVALRSAHRVENTLVGRNNTNGFRLVRVLTP